MVWAVTARRVEIAAVRRVTETVLWRVAVAAAWQAVVVLWGADLAQ